MPIRLAKYTDIPAIAHVCAKSFYDDELFGDMMHPFRAEYPEDYEQFYVRRFRENWYDWSHVIWVATTCDKEGKVIVAGVAEWELMGRAGKGREYRKLGGWNPGMAFPNLGSSHSSALSTNRAANPDPSLRNPFPTAHDLTIHHWTGARANSYYLDLLAIHPDYQGGGLAKELVQWGLDRAEEEGVSASVVSSVPGRGFYKRMGFDKEVGRCGEGTENPLGRLEGGWILFRDAKTGEGGTDE
ncbi:acyl-CoA N-acyltransferase [Delitschia confertaspora ATCC 74209]|uniref:Acyl-CoA N-acyltransferase n=1 Tax=Delitschia confertaspora ATCC 74209 TaxID=1513339 RepID=A0A9P4JEM0_9PLEO|nr:acyl-CoA N-acyltransferase [Delitschia confertaspora ATCC 74209]